MCHSLVHTVAHTLIKKSAGCVKSRHFRNTTWLGNCFVSSRDTFLYVSYKFHHKSTANMTAKSFTKGSLCPPRPPGVLRLYSMRFCPYAKRARLVLAAKKIPYETININLDDKPEWYLNLYPDGKVPVLEGDGKYLSESTVIADYLDDAYPGDKLNPADAYDRAREKMFLGTTFAKVPATMFKAYVNRDSAKEAFKEGESAFVGLEKELEKKNSTFFGGNDPSMLDLMMWPWFEIFMIFHNFLEEFPLAVIVPKENYPRLNHWIDEMLKVSFIQELHFPKELGLYWQSAKAGKKNFDAGL